MLDENVGLFDRPSIKCCFFYSPCRGTIHPLGQSPDQSQKGNGGAVRLPHTGKRKCRGQRLTSPPAWRDGVKEKGMLCNVMHESMNVLYFSSEYVAS